MARKRKKTNFGKATRKNVEDKKSKQNSFGYINLPAGMEFFEAPTKGVVRIDILPYVVTHKNHMDKNLEVHSGEEGYEWYKSPFRIHKNVGPEEKNIICPKSVGKPCPICELRAEKYKDGADQEEIKPLNSSLRNLYAVVVKGHKDYDEDKVYIWEMSDFLFQKYLDDELEYDESYSVFPDLEEGFTLKIRFREETFGKHSFPVTAKIEFEERDEVYDESILDDVPDLDELYKIPSYEEVEAAFYGGSVEENTYEEETTEDDEPEEEKPAPKKRRKKKKVEEEQEEVVDNHEVEDVTEEVVEDEPEEKPKRNEVKKKASGKCPHGHKFGVDTDQKEECEECELWDACYDKLEENE